MAAVIAVPTNIKNGYVNFDDPAMSTIVGLLLYGLDTNASFELDSNKKLRKRAYKAVLEPKVIKDKVIAAITDGVNSKLNERPKVELGQIINNIKNDKMKPVKY